MKITETSYQVRIMGCLVLVELLVWATFSLWPVQVTEKTHQDIIFSEAETTIEEIQITKQESSPPPPPPPQVPIPVPNDEVIDEEIVFKPTDFTEYSDSLSINKVGTAGDSDQIASNPEQAPGLVKIVEANTTDAAKKAGLKARVWVNFLVDQQGRVEEATIASIELYDKDAKRFKAARSLGYGLTEEILTAALQWKFRPAKNNGKPVRAYVKHAFNFGF